MRAVSEVVSGGRRVGSAVFTFVVLAVLGSCGTDGGTNPDPAPTPTISITVSPQSSELEQGQAVEVTVTVSRGGGYTGAVSLSFTGLVTGVQGTSGSIPSGSTQGTLTLTALETAPLGAISAQIVAAGSGVASVQRAFNVTITEMPVGTFGLSINPDAVSLEQGAAGSAQVTVDRSGGFTGPVTLAVEGAPAGLSATLAQTTVTGTEATLDLAPTGALAPGVYDLTIRGTGERAPSVETTLALTVTLSAVQVSWELCEGRISGDWFAVRDGDGTWRRIVPNGRTFDFEFRGERGAIAYVQEPEPGDRVVFVSLLSRDDFQIDDPVLASFPCVDQTRTLNVAAAPALANGAEFAAAAVDNSSSGLYGPGSAVLSFDRLPAGPLDLAGAYGQLLFPSGVFDVFRFFLSRGIDPASGSTVGMDFNGPNSFAPVPIDVTLANPNGQPATLSGALGTSRLQAVLFETSRTPTTSWVLPIPPASRLLPEDILVATISTEGDFDAPGDRYLVTEQVFRGEDDLTLTLGPELAGVSFSDGGSTTSFRGRVQYAVQEEYGNLLLTVFGYEVAGNSTIHTLTASKRYLGGNDLDETFPDLSTIDGWDPAWELPTGVPIDARFAAFGWTGDVGLNPVRARRTGDQWSAFLIGSIDP